MADRPIIFSTTTMRESGLATLRAAGELRMASLLDPSVLYREIADADALVVRTAGYYDGPLMDQAPRLRVIGRHGVGYDQIDVVAATERGIQVVYTPGANTQSVVEHVFAMLIALSKQFPAQTRALVEGRYNDRTRLVGRDIAGKTLGIVGLGRIGKRVGAVARLAFGMTVLYCDVEDFPADVRRAAGDAEATTFDDLLARSDHVTLHVPLDASTRRMIDRSALDRIKPGAGLRRGGRGRGARVGPALRLRRRRLRRRAAPRRPPPDRPDRPERAADPPQRRADRREPDPDGQRGRRGRRRRPRRSPAVAAVRRRLGKPPLGA